MPSYITKEDDRGQDQHAGGAATERPRGRRDDRRHPGEEDQPAEPRHHHQVQLAPAKRSPSSRGEKRGDVRACDSDTTCAARGADASAGGEPGIRSGSTPADRRGRSTDPRRAPRAPATPRTPGRPAPARKTCTGAGGRPSQASAAWPAGQLGEALGAARSTTTLSPGAAATKSSAEPRRRSSKKLAAARAAATRTFP